MAKGVSIRSSRRLSTLYDQITFCPSCSIWRIRLGSNPARFTLTSSHQRRTASTLTSTTAINATKPVPSRLKPLYDSVLDVKKSASSFVNTSRLQLALQGLETKNPTIRLAVLGLNVPETARRIVRLLLADPLEDEGTWEQQLAQGHGDYSRGLIVRYGREGNSNLPRPRNSVPILYVPAEVLERHNLEILVSSVNGPTNHETLQTANTPADVFLAPAVGTPTSFDGRQTVISQPVHKTILVTNGLDQLVAALQLLSSCNFSSIEDRRSVQIAVNLEGTQAQHQSDNPYIINASSAEQGLAAIRTSVTQATQYEHKWMASGMTELSEWMLANAGSEASPDQALPQSVESLIQAVLKAASINIEAARSSSYQTAAEQSLLPAQQISLEQALDNFSRAAHQELQSGLASAWSSRNWRKLAWYKLFWRVDDVGLIVTDLVNSAWLPNTERAVYELSGRLIQVGINPIIVQTPEPQDQPTPATEQLETASSATPLQLEPSPVSALATYTSQDAPSPSNTPAQIIQNQITTSTSTSTSTSAPVLSRAPSQKKASLTSTISSIRQSHIYKSTTNLTSTAQQLVLRTLSIAGLTGGLTLLTTTSFTLYEASTIFAVGLTYSLYKLQKGWQQVTRHFERELYNKGREVIIDITSNARNLINAKAEVKLDMKEIESLDRAEESVKKAMRELEKVSIKTNSK